MSSDLICKILQDSGYQAVICGGAVRDMIMGVEPHDFDIATSADPDIVVSILKKNKFCVKEVGKAFGVVLIDNKYEVATFRKDGKNTDGRRPNSVAFSSMEEDAKRRDFTINALFFDPISKKIYDFTNGISDIENKLIKFIGDPIKRIKEDKLRMIRAIRFAIKFGFEIDSKSFEAIKTHASEISIISPERINQELEKMLMLNKPSAMIDTLFSSKLLKEILPEIERLSRVPQDPRWHPEGAKVINLHEEKNYDPSNPDHLNSKKYKIIPGDALTHTKLVMEELKDENFEVQVAGMLHDIGKFSTLSIDETGIHAYGHAETGAQEAEILLKRLKFSNNQIEHIVFAVKNHMKLHDVSKMNKSTLKRLVAEPYFETVKKVAIADVKGSNKDFSEIEYLDKKIQEFNAEPKLPEPIVRGRDLISLGLKPGPIFKEILQKTMDAQLEGIIFNLDEGISFVNAYLMSNKEKRG